jgi:hypothetical protein
MIVYCTQLMCKKICIFLFFNLTFQCVLYFGLAKFVFPSTVLLGAVRQIICSEVLGRLIFVCLSKICKYAYFGVLTYILFTYCLKFKGNFCFSAV